MRHKSVKRRSRRSFLRTALIVSAGGGVLAAGAAVAGALATRPKIVVLPHGATAPGAEATSPRPAIVSRDEWGALPVDLTARNENGLYRKGSNPEGWYIYPADLRQAYQTIIIHHSVVYEANGLATLLEIQRLHREDRGWADIGYHFLIDKDGTLYEGRDLTARGAHTAGFNTGSAGICLLGDFRFAAASQAQLDAALALVRWLIAELEPTHLAGHQQFNPATLCPGRFLSEQLQNLASAAGLAFGIDGYRPAARAADPCSCCTCETHV